MFYCEYWKIFKDTYFEEHLRSAALLKTNKNSNLVKKECFLMNSLNNHIPVFSKLLR